MNKIIAFEGIPGTGKTTVIEEIIKRNLLKNCTAIPQLKIPQELHLEDNFSISKLYLDIERHKSKKINSFLEYCNYILLDRTFLTTLAYCYARSKMENDSEQYLKLLKYFIDLDKKHYFIRPNYVIYLTLSLQTSIMRRFKFSQIKEHHYWFNYRFLKYFSEFYNRKNFNKFKIPQFILIDTTTLDKKALIEKVIKTIHLLR